MEEHTTISRLQDQLEEKNQQLLRVEEKLNKERAAREDVEERLKFAEERLQMELAEAAPMIQEQLESDQYYKLLIENTNDVVYSVTPDGTMTHLSPQMIHFGYKPEELISKNFIDFVAHEQRKEVIRKFRTGTAAGDSFPTQFQWLRKDGRRTWVEVVGKTVFDESGIPQQQIGVIRDIDERKQQEEENRSLLLLLDTLDGECFIKDKDGIYQYINKAFETQFGVKREDVVGKDDAYVFGPEAAVMLRENDQRIMAAKKSEAVEESTYLQGQKFVVYLTNKTPIFDDNGNVTGICGVGVDITDQKEIENKLRQSEEKYRNLVEQISEVIYSIDMDGVITYISPAVESFLGYSPSEVIGHSFNQFIASDDLPHASNRFNQLTSGVISGPNEYMALTKSGETRWMRASSQPVMDGDQVVGVQGVLADITSHKMTEMQITQAATSAERERLARELHDSVTQTLYSVAAITEALPRIWERNPEQARAGLDELTTLTHAAQAEMRTLLLELRPGALEKQNLAELLRRLAQGLIGRTRMPVNLSVDDDCSMPTDVRIALYRITQEALNNIVKHARASQAQVSLECETGLVKLLVSDDGVGFNPQSVTSHRLGLDIMRERAQDIGAVFEIVSRADHGTQITLLWQDQQDE